jgi:hypothetical protein
METPEQKEEREALETDRNLRAEKLDPKAEMTKKIGHVTLVLIQVSALVFLLVGFICTLGSLPSYYQSTRCPYDPKLMLYCFSFSNFLEALFSLCYLIFYRKPIWFLGLVPSLTLSIFFGLWWYVLITIG